MIMLISNYLSRARDIKAQQNFNEFYTRYFSRHLSCYLTSFFSFTVISPNIVTLLMIFSGILGSLITLFSSLNMIIVGSLFMVLLNILDASDGELARYKNQTSNNGDYLDRIGHYITNSLYFLCIGISIFIITDNVIYIYIAILLEVSYTLDELLRDLLVTCGVVNDKIKSRKIIKKETKIHIFKKNKYINNLLIIFFSNLGFFHLSLILGVLDKYFFSNLYFLKIYFILFSVLTFLKLLVRVFLIQKTYFN